tara:strand:+ start:2924 stop:8779 length:5856 start_codon:yes stop_codon:yes gene_type:complete
MPLSRLDNFLKNVRGNVIYVNPNDLDATDSVENQGNSLARPFLTIQRALIESARFSYQSGLDNDRFNKTTIFLYPGDHLVDNRPGWIPDGENNYRLRNGSVSDDLGQFNSSTNFDLTSATNVLYKLNSVRGGVIVPRGTSIVSQDLRKTKIRPLYVPDSTNSNIERSAIFRLTGGCYIYGFTILDADPNGFCYKDYNISTFVPNFSHHKLTGFEFADGVNATNINDNFLDFYTSRTDLDMYYEKVGLVYGPASGREIQPDYPSSGLDIQTKVDEFRIVGPVSGSVGVSSIKAGDGVSPTTQITVTLSEALKGLDVDTAFEINGVSDDAYNGSFIVKEVTGNNLNGTTSFIYSVQFTPGNALPGATGVNVSLDPDTVSSASPYIFNISMRSVFGMCGLLADGDKALGFKSMVCAQFTGIGIQKDDNAFVVFDESTGGFLDNTTINNISSNPNAIYKPSYANFHIKASNDSICQLVSIFAIGYTHHFITEDGGDFSLSNSNSNFGQNALTSRGFKRSAFNQDDVGYISHIIPPKIIKKDEINLEYGAFDVSRTVGVGSTGRLYLYQETNRDAPPPSSLQGYRIGSKENDTINVNITQNEVPQNYSARIIMPNTQADTNQVSSVKIQKVGRNVTTGINSITNNTITFKENHNFLNGETIRFVSDDARLPDGLDNNRVYYAITGGSLSDDQIKVSSTLNEALSGSEISFNNLGGTLIVESRVSDKIAGEIGHPIQYDNDPTRNQWYINVGTAYTDNSIYPTIISKGVAGLGSATSRTFITRQPDTRSTDERIYRARYVIPAGSGITSARAPISSYVITPSSTVTGKDNTEVALQFNPNSVSMSNVNEVRNFSFIRHADWNSQSNVRITTELPHNVNVGAKVEIKNVTSTNNPTGIANSMFNGTYSVTGITSTNQFILTGSPTNPGNFTNNTSLRTTSLPTFRIVESSKTCYNYDTLSVKDYEVGEQDGVYYLTLFGASVRPVVAPFNTEDYEYSQSLKDLYPQYDRDNPNSDPDPTVSHATVSPLGNVVVDEVKNSVTRENFNDLQKAYQLGIGITDIVSNPTGTAHTIFTDIDHGLGGILALNISNAGAGYGSGGAGNIFNATLKPTGSSKGINATARITVNASGNITDVEVMTNGSTYAIGDNVEVVGVAKTTGFSVATLTITNVAEDINSTIKISGVSSDSYKEYNSLYKITGISSSNQFEVTSRKPIGGRSITGVGAVHTNDASCDLTGARLDVNSLTYNNVTGKATLDFVQNHGLIANDVIILGGADSDFYNDSFVVSEIVGLTTAIVNVGVNTITPGTGGTISGYYPGISARDGFIDVFNESANARTVNYYAGITTTISDPIADGSTTSIRISNVNNFNFQLGDYLKIGGEIVRVKSTVTGNPITVFRGVLGTQASSHVSGSVIRKIKVNPIELRRPSLIRATGHTFEYLGFGAGNYSTSLPPLQTTAPSNRQQLLAQSVKISGGTNNFNGTNDRGDFYIGNRKISSNTGKQELFEVPILSITGQDPFSVSGVNPIDISSPVEANIANSLKVEGGPNNNILSEFNGPTVFTEKLTSTSDDGLEAVSLFLQGNTTISRKFTVGLNKPTTAGNPGDVVFNANPGAGGIVGWVYSIANGWFSFGNLSSSQNDNSPVFDNVGIATTSHGDCTVKVGSGSSLVCIDADGVGIGTTANGAKLRVDGVIRGTFIGDGSGLSNLDSIWTENSEVVYVRDNADASVGIGTSIGTFAQLHIAGTSQTSIYAGSQSRFIGTADFNGDVSIGATLSVGNNLIIGAGATNISQINVGVVTSSTIHVGFGTTTSTFVAQSGVGVGIGTTTPSTDLDVNGETRFKTYHEFTKDISSSSGVVTIDLKDSMSFNLTTSENVTQFNLVGVTTGSSTAFTLKINQGSTVYGVGIDTFRTSGGGAIPVYWPGGVTPIVTPAANVTDIYSFMTFDGGSSLYGVIGGQNFS